MLSSSILFSLFVCSFVLFAVLGYIMLRTVRPNIWDKHLTDETIGITGSILAVLSIFVSIPLTFIILNVWNNYNTNLSLLKKRSLLLLQLYHETKNKNHIIHYLKHGDINIFGNSNTLELRNVEMAILSESNEVSNEIWAVLILGAFIFIVGTWLLKSPFYIHLFLIVSTSAILGSLIFLVYLYSHMHDCCSNDKNRINNELIKHLN